MEKNSPTLLYEMKNSNCSSVLFFYKAMNTKSLEAIQKIYSYHSQSCDSEQHGASGNKLASYTYANLELQNQKKALKTL